MKIQNQHIHGGNQQFADHIVNNYKNLGHEDEKIIEFVLKNEKDQKKQSELISALDIIKSSASKSETKSEATALWKKFLDSGLSELAKETVKSIVSGSIWATLLNI